MLIQPPTQNLIKGWDDTQVTVIPFIKSLHSLFNFNLNTTEFVLLVLLINALYQELVVLLSRCEQLMICPTSAIE
jgi:hypothetical protein